MLKPDIKPTDIELTMNDSFSQARRRSDNVSQRTDMIALSSRENHLVSLDFGKKFLIHGIQLIAHKYLDLLFYCDRLAMICLFLLVRICE